MNNPLISIIIPIYNVEQYLEQCLDSIVNQTYQNIEVLLIDDGSSDTSAEICKKYSEKDSRVHFYSREHEGPAEVRNYGLKKAKGDYIGFADSDDYLDLSMYQQLYEISKKHDADISITNYAFFENDEVQSQNVTGKVFSFDKEEILKLYIEENSEYMITPSVCTKLFKKEIVSGLEFPKGRICAEDFLFVTQAFVKAEKITYLDKKLYFYRQHSGSTMHNVLLMERRIKDEIELYEKRVNVMEEYGNKELISSAECAMYKRMILRYGELIKSRAVNSEYMQSLCKQIFFWRKKINIKKCIETQKNQKWIKSAIIYYYPGIYFEVLKKVFG